MTEKLSGTLISLIGSLALWLLASLVIGPATKAQVETRINETSLGVRLAEVASTTDNVPQVVITSSVHGVNQSVAINTNNLSAAAVGEWVVTGLAQGSISALTVDPTNSSVYAAGGEDFFTGNGSSIRKTSDGGTTWPIFYAPSVVALAIAPTNSNIIYASVSNGDIGSIRKTVNGGDQWVNAGNGLGYATQAAIAIDPSDPNKVYVGAYGKPFGAYDHGIYKTSTGGVSWTQKLAGRNVLTLVIDPMNTNVVYAGTTEYTAFGLYGEGGVFKSNNAGESWTKVMTHTQVNALVIDPTKPNVLYAATEGDGIFKSTNSGANWTPVNTGLTHPVVRALAIDPKYPDVLYAGTWEGGIFKSVNGGAGWNNFNTGLTNTFILSLALDPTGVGTLYAGTSGGGVFKVALAPPPPPLGSSYAKVVTENGQPVLGVQVYRNGSLAPGVTDAAGNLILIGVRPGDKLVALSPVYTQPTIRQGHAGWAYRVHQTSLTVNNDSSLQPFTVITATGPQTLTVKANNTLVLFNLLVSIEWDAEDKYMGEISQAVQSASNYLYDLTDGQMAFGQVAIYDNGEYWADADIQISTSNIVRPHAFVGGLTSADKAHVIRVGRGWNGYSGDQGTWDASDGYRTLAHEFGHYALYFYDEYFAYVFNQNGKLVGEASTLCVGPQNRNQATDATNASAMDWQYDSSELSARGVPGLWSPLCEQTVQWQLNPTANIYTDPGESTWETLARKYGDLANPVRWQLITPAQRGSIMAGPNGVPADILALPMITPNNSGISGEPRQLTVYGSNGKGYWGAIVSLYKKGDGRVIAQGFTDGKGYLSIYGVEVEDTIRAASFDGGLFGSVVVGSETNLNLHMVPVGGLTTQATNIPHMRVIAQPGQNTAQIDLLISLRNFGPTAKPALLVTQPGSEVGYAPTLSYSASEGTYNGAISFSATERGTGRIRVLGNIEMQSTYRLQEVINNQGYDIFSDDGNLSLYLKSNSFQGNKTYFVVMPPGAVPGSLPSGMVLVGNVYDVTASGGVVPLQQSAILSLRYDGVLVNPKTPPPTGLGLYRWDPNDQVWLAIPSQLDEEHKTVIASINNLGAYALLAFPGSWSEPTYSVFLPVIIKR